MSNGSEKEVEKDIWREINECKRAYNADDKVEATLFNIYNMKKDFYAEHAKEIETKPLPEEKLIEESFRQGKVLFPNLTFKKADISKFFHEFAREITMLNDEFQEEIKNLLDTVDDYFSKKDESKEYDEYIELDELKKLFINDLDDEKENALNTEAIGEIKDFYVLALTFTLSSLTELYFNNELQNLDTHLWDKGYCPVCGLHPHYGMLQESDGKRILECWMCDVRWEFPRIACAYCHNQKQDELGYFTADKNPLCRVHFCSKCNNYIKIFDIRKYGKRKAILPIHHLVTLSYDLMAVREGFIPGSGLEWVNKEELKI